MNHLNESFRQRMGIPMNEKITFESLDNILVKTATTLPFENLCILANIIEPITKENLINKILVRNEGGLCYQLNPLLYFFLLDNGFNAVLVRGDIYNHEIKDWSKVGRSHVFILLQHESSTYLVDTGFGGNLALKPIPLTGETTASANGEFRVITKNSEHGDCIFEMKLKYKDTEWKTGYAFDSKRAIADLTELNELQKTIVEHQHSRFNKTPLITQLTSDGNVTLTDTSFTQWSNGESKKDLIDPHKFKELAKLHFGI